MHNFFKTILLFTTISMTTMPALAGGSLDGRTVTFRVLAFDDPANPLFIGQGRTVQIGKGVEFGLSKEGSQNDVDVVPVEVNISDTRIELDYANTHKGKFLAATFNGYELTFPTQCALIMSASIDGGATNLPLDSSALTFEPGRLLINVEGLSHSQTSQMAIDVEVGDCPLS
ncbi:MAG: hypothetical protein ABI459_07680 [Deltaproteobacteria bacterium]